MQILKKSSGWLSQFLILSALVLLTLTSRSFASVAVSFNIDIAPPVLPVYEQPVCPGDGYIWTPGYWAYGPGGYYWVPGVWVQPPQVGLFWTPGYWECVGVTYVFHSGYWGPHVGFYGGVNYGFGYDGYGYYGGRWDSGRFVYDSRFNNVRGLKVRTYTGPAIRHDVDNRRVSYNGGRNGLQVKASEEQQRFAQEERFKQTKQQRSNQQQAGQTNHTWASASNNSKTGTPTPVRTRPNNYTYQSRPVTQQTQVARNPGPGDSYQRKQTSASRSTPQEFMNYHAQQQRVQQLQPRQYQQQPRPQQQQHQQQSRQQNQPQSNRH